MNTACFTPLGLTGFEGVMIAANGDKIYYTSAEIFVECDNNPYGWNWLPNQLNSLNNNQTTLIIGDNIIDAIWYNKMILVSDFVTYYNSFSKI